MNYLPIECTYKILSHLHTKDVINYISTCKDLYTLVTTRYFWIKLAMDKYNCSIKKIQNLDVLRQTYKSLYSTRCVCCSVKTKDRHLIFNELLVCKSCTKSNFYYNIISSSEAVKQYKLRRKDLLSSNYTRISVGKETYFLLRDVHLVHKKKYPNKVDFIKKIIKDEYTKETLRVRRINNELKLVEYFIDCGINYNQIRYNLGKNNSSKFTSFLMSKEVDPETFLYLKKIGHKINYSIKYITDSIPFIDTQFIESIDEYFKIMLQVHLLNINSSQESFDYLNEYHSFFSETLIDLYTTNNFLICVIKRNEIRDTLLNTYDGYFLTNNERIYLFRSILSSNKRSIYPYICDPDNHCLENNYIKEVIEYTILENFLNKHRRAVYNYRDRINLISDTLSNGYVSSDSILESVLRKYLKINC